MTKIANHVFQTFLCSISTHHDLNISCILKKARIGNDWYKKGMKKIEKDSWKSQIQEHWLNGFWTCFVNLIHSTYKQKHNPNQKTSKLRLRPRNNFAFSLKKIQNWKHSFSAFQGKITIPIACQGHQGSIPIKTTTSNIKNR